MVLEKKIRKKVSSDIEVNIPHHPFAAFVTDLVDVTAADGLDSILALGAATGGLVLSGLASVLLHPKKL